MQPGRATHTPCHPRFELPAVIREFVGLWTADEDVAPKAEPSFELATFRGYAVRGPRGAGYAPRWG